MIRLPHHDPSPTRAAELAERRERYRWDHEFLPPFPFLHIPDVQATGVLEIYDILAGTYASLPVEEQPSDRMMIRKVLGGGPALYELLERVPRTEWVVLMRSCREIAERQFPRWVAHALRELLPQQGQRRLLRTILPGADQVTRALTELMLRSLDEVSTAVLAEGAESRVGDVIEQLGRSMESTPQGPRMPSATDVRRVLRGFVRDTVDAMIGSARARAGELLGRSEEGPAEEEEAPSPPVAAPRLPEAVERIVAPGELLVRFTAKLRRYRPTGPSGQRVPIDALITDLTLPDRPDPTTDDAEFGWRHVAGTNPVMLRRVNDAGEDIPGAFAVADSHLQVALAALGLASPEDATAQTLARAAAEGRLYFTDYAVLADIPCQSGPDLDFFGQSLPEDTARSRYLPAPFGLFYRWGEGEGSGLWPVAIQLGRDPEQYEVFTPAVEPELWSRVKTLYLCADFNHHEMATHLAGVHFTLEGFAVATARQLHRDHPIAVLLEIHLRFLLWNNFLGRQILTNPQGFVEQLLSGVLEGGSNEIMNRHYQQWEFSDWHLPRALARRGVDDREVLPHYPFRDDGLRLWDALHGFVAEYVALYYPSPEDLARDHELSAWCAELHAEDGAHVRGFPASIDSREVLVDVLTSIIFQSSPVHSAVNYGQFDLQCDSNRIPAAVYADPRRVRELETEQYLPSAELTVTQAGIMYVLADLRDDCLGQYELSWFEDPRVWPLVAGLRQQLQRIEAEIERDNATSRRARPYEYLRPSLVTTAANV